MTYNIGFVKSIKEYFCSSKKLLFILLFIVCIVSYCDQAFTAADIPGSSDKDIKFFNNWKVYKLQLKNNKKFIVAENLRNGDTIFRMIFDKNNNIGYFDFYPNYKGFQKNTKQKGNVVLYIGNSSYNLPAVIEVINNYVVTSIYDMPINFIDIAKNNKLFYLSYHPALPPGTPIDLNGFNQSIEYVKKLLKSI